MKKALSILLTIALIITLLPPSAPVAKAAGANNFTFVNEQYSPESARVTTNERVTLNGTINNVIGSTISYSVYQINLVGDQQQVVNSNENQTSNITLSGNSIAVYNLQLFPGLNRITFKGTQGNSDVSDSIYIEYRNSPTLYNLVASLDGLQYEIQEEGTTVIHSVPSQGKSSADISISGRAPNADKVTVIVNNKSYTYSVNSTTNWSFIASPVNIRKGKNTVTIRVFNKNQFVETVRDVAFYNGQVTFYDMNLTTVSDAASLERNPNFSVEAENIKLKGKAIVPVKYDADTGTYKPSITEADLKYRRTANGAYSLIPVVTNEPGYTPTPSTRFMTLLFEIDLGTAGSGALPFDTLQYLQFQGMNVVKVPAGTDTSDLYTFRLRNKGLAFIEEIKFLPGFSGSTSDTQLEGMQGLDMKDADVFSLPMGVELLIGNPDAVAGNLNIVQIKSITDSTGKRYTDTDAVKKYDYEQRDVHYFTVKNVDGIEKQYARVFVQINKLPSTGKQTLNFALANAQATTDEFPVPITLLYGPYAKFETIYDGMQIKFDTTMQDSEGIDIITNEFGDFKGELLNIANSNDIRYTAAGGETQTVFFYVNNTEIPLEMDDAANNTNKAKFRLADGVENKKAAYNALYKSGENNIRIIFRTNKNNYQRDIKITLIPTNLPVIPAPNTEGVFPYSVSYNDPMPNDPNFQLTGNVYATKEARAKIYGTFGFIDLGTTLTSANSKRNSLGDQRTNYRLKITTAGKKDINWTLDNQLVTKSTTNASDNNQILAGNVVEGITVLYDFDKQSFAFMLPAQDLPSDGSPLVYNFYVYNSGENGPRASYRLEINPTTIPYTVLAPIREKRTLNQNYVEVIINSPGAETITINKVPAKKVIFRDYNDMVDGLPRLIPAFSAQVTNLRAGRDNKIDIVITRGKDRITDYFNVKYVPENIPGAQMLQKMTSSHKVFDNKLTLSFTKGTNLIRPDYNLPENLKGQVYEGNNLLFAIANPEDGVVDRHDYETVPANYDLDLSLGKILFSASFPQRFIKSSPVYWIDAGQADDPQTDKVYDPVAYGFDPYPFSVIEGESRPYYFNRPNNRELVPSKRGTLTLSYDPSIRQSGGVLVTVFRFDYYTQQWENIGGVVDDKKNTVRVPFDKFGYYVVAKLSYGFNDVTDHPYGRESMESIFAKGVMNAVDPSGSFGGDQYVTRAEFSRMLVRALEMKLSYDGATHFVDVPNLGSGINMESLWDYRYVETAARAGIVRGTQPRVFDPESAIIRQDAAVMLAKALNMKLETDASKVRSALQKAFMDEGSMDFYASPSILAIQKKGFIQGAPVDVNDPKRGKVFQPKARLLRSDAAIIIAKVMADQKKLPKLLS
ncbi:S-layer homology domain-containing protein [Paenibacillus sp. GCM10012307]|uniref:S-layer homology domain-containing protein n=1 Tax=Paenibacillus roseus TaxID=2798579 RepID=A0A934J711_9BACL|nr:S-layer homology domain-containing protein [Paenibacillus roseus]MBJ6361911.1 S-layer homology domain-containing protein [Paenibacillus roseus]